MAIQTILGLLVVIKDGDIFPEREQEITSIIERVVKQAVGI